MLWCSLATYIIRAAFERELSTVCLGNQRSLLLSQPYLSWVSTPLWLLLRARWLKCILLVLKLTGVLSAFVFGRCCSSARFDFHWQYSSHGRHMTCALIETSCQLAAYYTDAFDWSLCTSWWIQTEPAQVAQGKSKTCYQDCGCHLILVNLI